MKKVLVSDYDQTFYVNDEDIELNKQSVQQFRDNGNIFVIATGRSFMDLKKKVKQYNLKYDYAILDHGAMILDCKDNIILQSFIEPKIIEDIKNDLCLEKSISHFCCSLFEGRVDFEHENLTKIDVKYSNKEDAWNINEYINKKYGEYVNSYFLSSNAIEIISNKTNKSYAIKYLLKYLEIEDMLNVYTIGDGYSDIDMIKDFNGYCMENSVPELKEITPRIVKSVSELIKIIIEE